MTVQTKLSFLGCVCASVFAVAIPLISVATEANEPSALLRQDYHRESTTDTNKESENDLSLPPNNIAEDIASGNDSPESDDISKVGQADIGIPSTALSAAPENGASPSVYPCPATVSVLNTKTGKTNEMPLETYIIGVVSAEMLYTFNIEALKAQAVAARSYCLYQMEHGTKHDSGADICTSYDHCAAYISEDDLIAKYGKTQAEKITKKVTEAVDATRGQVILYEGKAALALFHSRSYGKTEAAQNVWGGSLPYLTSVDTPEEDYLTTVTVSKEKLADLFAANGNTVQASTAKSTDVLTLSANDSGRVNTLYYDGYQIKGKTARSLLKLKSCDFTVENQGDSYVFAVHGYGHGVGMSQYGANTMANEGLDYRSILLHYYPGVSISR